MTERKPFRLIGERGPLSYRHRPNGRSYVHVPDENPDRDPRVMIAKAKLEQTRNQVYIVRVTWSDGRRDAYRCPDLRTAREKLDRCITPLDFARTEQRFGSVRRADILRGVAGAVVYVYDPSAPKGE